MRRRDMIQVLTVISHWLQQTEAFHDGFIRHALVNTIQDTKSVSFQEKSD